jgi:hypothetical protein
LTNREKIVIVGNGESRKEISLPHLLGICTVYGCNALHHDFHPDKLFVRDVSMAEEIEASGYSREHSVVCWNKIQNHIPNAEPFEDENVSSGHTAIEYAIKKGFKRLFLLGFDLGAFPDGSANNIYKDSGVGEYEKEKEKDREDNRQKTILWTANLLNVVRGNRDVTFYKFWTGKEVKPGILNGEANLLWIMMDQFWECLRS